MNKQKVIEILNTKFGIGEYENYFQIAETRIREDPDKKGIFILSTNSGDNTSEKIIKSLGFEVVEVRSILDARYINFKEGS